MNTQEKIAPEGVESYRARMQRKIPGNPNGYVGRDVYIRLTDLNELPRLKEKAGEIGLELRMDLSGHDTARGLGISGDFSVIAARVATVAQVIALAEQPYVAKLERAQPFRY